LAFKQRLEAEGNQDLAWTLGRLAVTTVDNLAKLTDTEFQQTLKLIQMKRPEEPMDLSDHRRFAPGHLSILRRLRDAVLREVTPSGADLGSTGSASSQPSQAAAAVVAEPVAQPADGRDTGSNATNTQAAEITATEEAGTQLRDAEAKVRAVLDSESPGQPAVAYALQGLVDAARHLNSQPPAEGAAASLNAIRQAARYLAASSLPSVGPTQAVKAAERTVRDVVVWRCLGHVDPRDRKEFVAALQAAFGVSELDADLQAQLLLSHRKIASNVVNSFMSNGQRATLWRGTLRPRRKKRDGQASAAIDDFTDSEL